MRSAVGRVALLLFASGLCALVYQTAWLRMFRLIFGASTAASAAVLAIFMAGLGFGGLLLGKRADRHPSPLGLYAMLEAGIAVTAGLSPWLVELVERVYISLGGSARLGLGGSTVVRLLLAILVLGVPTFLMGGTLPAVARAVERGTDAGRRVVGLLYAVNTLGAVLGTLGTTFFALEALGIRKTVWVAALLNILVVLAARSMARQLPVAEKDTDENTEETGTSTDDGGTRGGLLVPVAAGVVGFAFLLMELVWYRMLGPLLGGSSYTFGLILAVALLGIGLGGLLYGAGEGRRRPTMLTFALTCSLEALFMALPFALGDHVAVMAALLRPFGGAGFWPLVVVWTVITALAVLPAAVVAGYQFPLLIALLGSGRRQVGREVGVTYAANTLGAIVGSIAGGFGLIPLLTATGVWRLVALLLLALGAVAVVAGLRAGAPSPSSRWAALGPLLAGAVGLAFALAPGPSVYWRHTAIGAGREQVAGWTGPNEIQRRLEEVRRRVQWEADGVESSVALDLSDEYAFIVNGKSDGSALSDAPTQVMSGLLGTAVHPNPRRALVIGLGTGSTAGWLARVPTMERVDVVELEPVIEHVSTVLAPINLDVLSNPKVHLVTGDGRELLLTTDSTYDVIFSEPSNPYRAGIASLFSADFYRAVEQRLRPGGFFLQWLQGYEIDARAVQTAYATLGEVFPSVESWRVHRSDLLLMASREPVVHDLGLVRSRMAQEPYRTALARIWGVEGVEGFYTGYAASPAFSRAMREPRKNAINTDDRPILEFGFARNLGRFGLFNMENLLGLAQQRGENRPATRGEALDWSRVAELRMVRSAYWEIASPDPDPQGDPAARSRIAARLAFLQDDTATTCRRWFEQPEPPRQHMDLLAVGTCLADEADPRAPQLAAQLAREQPIEADFVLARWHAAAGRIQEAGRHLLAAMAGYRKDPWVNRRLVNKTLPLCLHLARQDPALGRSLWQAMGTPFAIHMFQQQRLALRAEITRVIQAPDLCVASIEPLEPHVPWDERFLRYRFGCYQAGKHPLAERARQDLKAFLESSPPELSEGLPAAP